MTRFAFHAFTNPPPPNPDSRSFRARKIPPRRGMPSEVGAPGILPVTLQEQGSHKMRVRCPLPIFLPAAPSERTRGWATADLGEGGGKKTSSPSAHIFPLRGFLVGWVWKKVKCVAKLNVSSFPSPN